MSPIAIQKEIEATLGPDAIGYSPVAEYIRETQIAHDSELTPTLIEDECPRLVDKVILLALADEPFTSAS
jgi:hypothetical protein